MFSLSILVPQHRLREILFSQLYFEGKHNLLQLITGNAFLGEGSYSFSHSLGPFTPAFWLLIWSEPKLQAKKTKKTNLGPTKRGGCGSDQIQPLFKFECVNIFWDDSDFQANYRKFFQALVRRGEGEEDTKCLIIIIITAATKQIL